MNGYREEMQGESNPRARWWTFHGNSTNTAWDSWFARRRMLVHWHLAGGGPRWSSL